MLSAPSQECFFPFDFASQCCFLTLPPASASASATTTVAAVSSSAGSVMHAGKCLMHPGISGVLLYSNARSYKLFCSSKDQLKSFPLHHLRRLSIVCNASSNNYRRNPDFSRQQKGSSRGRNRQYQERDDSENSEETDFISKNGSLLSLSNNPRYQATAVPGQREKEIVELFRKVQAQLRERAAIKEEKKIEAAQQGQSERGTVDSLLKLLRKHSVDQRKTTSAEEDVNHDQTEDCNLFDDEQKSNFPSLDDAKPKNIDEVNLPPSSRPVSNFRRRSPVPRVKFQPVFSGEEEISSTSVEDASSTPGFRPKGKRKKNIGREAKVPTDADPSPLTSLDELSVNDQLDLSDSDEAKEVPTESFPGEGSPDLTVLKLAELRDLAKSRGIKGYSKLKKGELVELLSG